MASRKLPGQVVLVFQGGGALGAYQVGVYEALHEAGIEPDWVIGTSIGAINAGLIAGNAPENRLDQLRDFWKRIEQGSESDPLRFFTGISNVAANMATLKNRYIVTDNNPSSPFFGRTYLTSSKFESAAGEYISSAIFEAHSDDGGFTWTEPKEISGSNPALCTFQNGGPAGECDQNQFSVPTIGPDGTVYVAFENEQNESLWEPGEQFEDQYLMVTSANGGGTFSSPTFIVGHGQAARQSPTKVSR